MNRKVATKRQCQAIDTRNIIYEAAIGLMDRRGFENITVADIAQKAQVSVGSFYHHFKSKNDILVEIFRRGDDYFTTEVAPVLGNTNVPDEIVTFFDHYARFCLKTGLATARQLYRPSVKQFVTKGRSMQKILENLVARGQANGEIQREQDALEIATMLFVFARGILFDWCLRDGKYDLSKRMRDYIKALVGSITR